MEPIGSDEFELWWKSIYKGKLGATLIEWSFQEIARNAWEAGTLSKDSESTRSISHGF